MGGMEGRVLLYGDLKRPEECATPPRHAPRPPLRAARGTSARASEQQFISHDPLRPFVNVVISSSLFARSLHLGKIKVASPPHRPPRGEYGGGEGDCHHHQRLFT